MATTSLESCLPAIRKLVETKVFKFQMKLQFRYGPDKVSNLFNQSVDLQDMFAFPASGQLGQFEQSIVHYNNIVAPFIWALWSLEAADTNASDVYVFWLAIAANLNNLFKKGMQKTGISLLLSNAVMEIYNKRYIEFFNHSDIYFAAFMLDPRI
jgi:hypothetical protein